MLKSSSRVKKSRGGYIFKQVKEHYLRKEIPCGIVKCSQCKSYPNIEILDPSLDGGSSLFTSGHLLIPQAEILVKQIDFFENDKIANVIIFQTVLNSIKNINLGVHKRLQALISSQKQFFYVFNNEFHIDCFVEQEIDESSKEWESRLFASACNWYVRHVFDNFPGVDIVVLFSEKIKGLIAAVNNLTIHDYVKSLIWHDELIDSIVMDNSQLCLFKEMESSIHFPEHPSHSTLNLGIKTGKYLCGTYKQDSDDFGLGSVKIKSSNTVYQVSGLININRTFDNDFVVIEPVTQIPISQGFGIDEGNNFDIIPLCEMRSTLPDENYCRIVGILRRNWKQYSGGIFNETPKKGLFLFRAVDSRIPFILFESQHPEHLKDKKFCVTVDCWDQKFRYPFGHFVKILGDIGDKKAESDSILFDQNIPFQKFSNDVLRCLAQITSLDSSNKLSCHADNVLKHDPNRLDLRKICVCSIDPPGCTDIDDAVHCRLLPGNDEIYEVGIHIADVTHYVLPGTALDKEAYRRGTTVYLVDRRVDMLPDLLSSNLCSLKPNEDRLAFSVLCYMDSESRLLDHIPPVFSKSVIKSRKAFTYTQAQNIIDDATDKSEISLMLKKLSNLTKNLRERRLERGALVLESSEIRFEVDSETLEPVELNIKETIETNKLIESCMLLANVLVAQKIYNSFPQMALLRCHPFPSSENIKRLFNLIRSSIDVEITPDPTNLHEFLKKTESLGDTFVSKLVKILTIRCLQQAYYICSGCHSPESYYHYGLAEPIYTHFTSPIRRYPDILVHRMLSAAINSTNSISFYDSRTIQQMCDHLNRRHVSAQLASRESIRLHLYSFIKTTYQGTKLEKAYVTKIHTNAISVYVPAFQYQGIIRFDPKKCESHGTIINPDSGFIKFFDSSQSLSILNSITVCVTIDIRQFSLGGMKLILYEPHIPGISQ